MAPADVSAAGRPLRVGVVPEHFCAPLHLALADGTFQAHGLDVVLVNCPGGTGQMLKRLENKELDVTIGLTEGLINSLVWVWVPVATLAAIANGNDDIRLVGTYVEAPLTWAVSTGASSPHTSVASLQGGTIGISRLGSGSHIMAVVLAEQSGWMTASPSVSPQSQTSSSDTSSSGTNSDGEDDVTAVDPASQLSFRVLHDFEGLRQGVNAGRADAFLWETFTTKPYHDCKEVKRIGEVRAPWAAFLIAARRDVLDTRAAELRQLLDAVSKATARFIAGTADGSSQAYVARTYGQQPGDVDAWFATVRYPVRAAVLTRTVLGTCLQSLRKARLVQHSIEPASLIDERVAILSDRAAL